MKIIVQSPSKNKIGSKILIVVFEFLNITSKTSQYTDYYMGCKI